MTGTVSWEIERRFLVRVHEDMWPRLGTGSHLKQGYIRNGSPSVRVRFGEERGAVLTSKSGSGIRRREVEVVIPDQIAEALFLSADDRVVEKIRWKVGPWELDRFIGPLEGLTLMEIELEEERDTLPDPPPGVQILRDVTDDKRFVNGRLARMSSDEKRNVIRKAYAEVQR